jgi:uncharacterized protein (DUF934 family)
MSEVLTYPREGNAHFAADDWVLVQDVADLDSSQRALMPLSVWQALPSDAPAKTTWSPARLGIALTVNDDVLALEQTLAQGLPRWSLITVDFPVFRDGRGYSQAAWLRHHLGWQGELRAVGDVLIDQLRAMARVGFDSFALRADQDSAAALVQFHAFAHQMQGDWRASRSQLAVQRSAHALAGEARA